MGGAPRETGNAPDGVSQTVVFDAILRHAGRRRCEQWHALKDGDRTMFWTTAVRPR